MPRIATSIVVDPNQLDPRAKEAFIERLYELHTRIFDVEREAFVAYVIDSRAEHTHIQVYEDASGRAVGYFALHIFEKVMGGEKLSVMRGELGMVSEFRGCNVNARFAIDRLLRYLVKNPDRRLYLFASPVHPSCYSQTARYADRVWPNGTEETPADVHDLMIELARSFGLRAVDEARPFVRHVGWRTRDTAADRSYWLGHAGDAAHFYVRQNPGFVDGHGLLMLVPLSLGGVMRAALRFASAKLSRRLRHVVASLAGRRRSSVSDPREGARAA
ncbi:hypothetical protein KEG38_51805 [Polyangium jinanense]|uniref:hypothetical protein n=1 Tax=Polyangium jinanense TaxID=2829994 RepID=UPI0023409DEE|nr:hypothetical protein [Polyangium jinanense]MDC3962409.1 hypothetical protein [Polyangium jinanense]